MYLNGFENNFHLVDHTVFMTDHCDNYNYTWRTSDRIKNTKLKQKHAYYMENTKIVQSVCTEVLFVLDSKKTQVEIIFPIEINIFCSSSYQVQVDP